MADQSQNDQLDVTERVDDDEIMKQNLEDEAESELEKLKTELEEAKADRLRALADYQNLQRRTQEDRTRMAKMANVGLVTDLLDHLDHLSMAADQLKDKGLEMTLKQLRQTLEDHGLREIEAVGKHFDPEKMEVVESTTDNPKAKVSKVIRRGYELNGIVIRVAKVVL